MKVLSIREDDGCVRDFVNSLPGPLEILEAGCGRRWSLQLTVPYRLTGIDIDADALRERVEIKKDLDEAIVGDIRTALLPEATYDVIYSAWVLEHVPDAEHALLNFCRWLKPGGFLIVRVPDGDSLCGWLTRLTPHWFHVAYYRYFLRLAWAGTPGHGPYKTYYDEVISRRGMRQFCAAQDLSLRELRCIDTWLREQRVEQRVVARALVAATLGLVPWRWSALTLIAQKP
jgi:SAM-dependent methyltransferase